jgi:hypothetical protein
MLLESVWLLVDEPTCACVGETGGFERTSSPCVTLRRRGEWDGWMGEVHPAAERATYGDRTSCPS